MVDYGRQFQERFVSSEGRVTTIPRKRRLREELLKFAAAKFEEKTVYSEAEVDIVLAGIIDDYIWLRRMLIDYDYLKRDPYGKSYELRQA